MDIATTGIYCIHFNKLNKNNSNFLQCRSLFFAFCISSSVSLAFNHPNLLHALFSPSLSMFSSLFRHSPLHFSSSLSLSAHLFHTQFLFLLVSFHLFIFQDSYSFDTYNYLCMDYPFRCCVCVHMIVLVPLPCRCRCYCSCIHIVEI